MVSLRNKKSSPRRSDDKAAFWFDVFVRVLLGACFAFVAGVYFTRAFSTLRHASGLEQAVDTLSIFAMGFFAFLVAYLYATRLRSVSKFAGPIPAITAVLGAFITWGLLLLHQRMDLTIGVRFAADVLILGGNIFALFALYHLGRSFSILPESRALVTSGPYRLMRHPLYVAEAFATIGAMIHFFSPLAVLLVATQFALQFVRMHYEEKTLRETFPEYVKYSRRTARLIPGIY